jgi:hypothetical protein
VHYDNITIVNNTLYITTTTPSSITHGGYWGYRLIRIREAKIVSYYYKESPNSIPIYKINCSYINPYEAIIENNLEENIYAHLEFLVSSGNYTINNGEIIKKREEGGRMQIYVRVKVEKKSKSRVAIEEV